MSLNLWLKDKGQKNGSCSASSACSFRLRLYFFLLSILRVTGEMAPLAVQLLPGLFAHFFPDDKFAHREPPLQTTCSWQKESLLCGCARKGYGGATVSGTLRLRLPLPQCRTDAAPAAVRTVLLLSVSDPRFVRAGLVCRVERRRIRSHRVTAGAMHGQSGKLAGCASDAVEIKSC